MRRRLLLPIVAVLATTACGGRMRPDQALAGLDMPDPGRHLRPISSSDGSCAVVDLDGLDRAEGDTRLVGCEVAVDDVIVERLATGGFWVAAAGRSVLVVPAEGPLVRVEPGEKVDVHGEVKGTRADPRVPPAPSWVYAYTVRPAWIHK